MTTKATAKSDDAIASLTKDHAKVKKMFKEFEKLHETGADEECDMLAQQICAELTVHATIEEEIFYPAVKAVIDDHDMMSEAEIEHGSAKDLITDIETMDSSDDKFAPSVKVLGEYISHHAGEEEREMFPKARKTKLDFQEMGVELDTRREELKTELGIAEENTPVPASQPAADANKGNGSRATR